jgi:uncharacterized lipoprotein YddW (UPF0748 family)
MYDLTGIATFKEYADRWEKYRENKVYNIIAFIVKAIQKIKE